MASYVGPQTHNPATISVASSSLALKPTPTGPAAVDDIDTLPCPDCGHKRWWHKRCAFKELCLGSLCWCRRVFP